MHRLQVDVATRWDSSLAMCLSFLKAKEALQYLARRSSEALPAHLREILEEDWVYDSIGAFTTVLQPMRELTQSFSSQTAPVAAFVVVAQKNLCEHMKKIAAQRQLPEAVRSLARNINEQLTTTYNKQFSAALWTLCGVLNPFLWRSVANQSAARTILREGVQAYLGTGVNHGDDDSHDDVDDDKRHQPPPPPSSTQDLMWGPPKTAVSDETDPEVTAREDLESEISSYLRVHLTPQDQLYEQVLHWWKGHQHSLPTLSSLARLLLATPASSASSERLFSQARLLYESMPGITTQHAERYLVTRSLGGVVPIKWVV